MHPLPSVMGFNKILTEIMRMEHYSAVISLNKQMRLLGIAPNVYTLAIVINCFVNLNHMFICIGDIL